METIEQAPEEPLTLEQMCDVARRYGHSLFFGQQYAIDVEYAVGCRNCGAQASWIDEDAKSQLNPASTFLRVYNKPCGAGRSG